SLLAPLAYGGWRELYVNILEKNRPTIAIENPPPGLGNKPITIQFDVADTESGLDEVIVRSSQEGELNELFRKRYDVKTTNDRIQLTLEPNPKKFYPGQVEIMISAYDRSYWSNGRRTSLMLRVDYDVPTIKVLTQQHNGVIGGAQLSFYQVEEGGDALSGVTVGGYLFPGFQAKNLDRGFEARPDIYFSFFAIPFEFDDADDKIKVFARDAVGNVAYDSMYYRVRNRSYGTATVTIPDEYAELELPKLVDSYYALDAAINLNPRKTASPPQSSEEQIAQLQMVVNDYQGLIETSLQPLFARPKLRRPWTGAFRRPSVSAVRGDFGEQVTMMVAGKAAASYRRSGVDFAAPEGSEVRAAQAGWVIFSDTLGPYGTTVILDHGFGLYTLYAHLSEASVVEGDELRPSDLLGRSGSSGFALRPTLRFEVRLHGVPVRPAEWWDARWVDEHIESRIERMKRLSGIPTSLSLDPL
ncbi:MAG: M23 family metallopeptidase, partial [Bdellovibrionales bacterium]|nr:M23 family metallopeptidase [Bdellovibrionales bacterium]